MPSPEPPLSFRPPRPLRVRLLTYAQGSGRSVNGVMTEAVAAYLNALGAPDAAPVEPLAGGSTPGDAGGTKHGGGRPRRRTTRG